MPLAEGTEVTVNGVTAEVSVDGASKGINERGPWRRVVYVIPYDDSDTFMDGLKGIGNTPFPVGGSIIFPNPHAYPGNEKLRCRECSAVPVGAVRPDAKLISADLAFIEALYDVPSLDIDGTDSYNGLGGQSFPYSRVNIRGYTQTEPIPASVWVTKGENMTAGVPLDRKDSISYAAQDVGITLFYRPYMADLFLNQFVDRTNASTFLGRAAGTWLFKEYDSDPGIDGQGNRYNDYPIRLQWREHDWNARPMDDGAGNLVWERLWDGANYKYPYQDWSDLEAFFQGNV